MCAVEDTCATVNSESLAPFTFLEQNTLKWWFISDINLSPIFLESWSSRPRYWLSFVAWRGSASGVQTGFLAYQHMLKTPRSLGTPSEGPFTRVLPMWPSHLWSLHLGLRSKFWRDTLQTLEPWQLTFDGPRNVSLMKPLHVRYNSSLPFQLLICDSHKRWENLRVMQKGEGCWWCRPWTIHILCPENSKL